MMSWSLQKKKEWIFEKFILSEEKFFNIFFISIYGVLNELSEYIFILLYTSKNITLYTFVGCFQSCRKPSVYP